MIQEGPERAVEGVRLARVHGVLQWRPPEVLDSPEAALSVDGILVGRPGERVGGGGPEAQVRAWSVFVGGWLVGIVRFYASFYLALVPFLWLVSRPAARATQVAWSNQAHAEGGGTVKNGWLGGWVYGALAGYSPEALVVTIGVALAHARDHELALRHRAGGETE